MDRLGEPDGEDPDLIDNARENPQGRQEPERKGQGHRQEGTPEVPDGVDEPVGDENQRVEGLRGDDDGPRRARQQEVEGALVAGEEAGDLFAKEQHQQRVRSPDRDTGEQEAAGEGDEGLLSEGGSVVGRCGSGCCKLFFFVHIDIIFLCVLGNDFS